jgi:hypothetical protein
MPRSEKRPPENKLTRRFTEDRRSRQAQRPAQKKGTVARTRQRNAPRG